MSKQTWANGMGAVEKLSFGLKSEIDLNVKRLSIFCQKMNDLE